MTASADLECEILRLHYAEHWPVGTIATQMAIHADVVRRVLGHRSSPDPTQVFRRSSMMEPYSAFIEDTLKQFPSLRATRLYDMLRERGFTGSPRTVRTYVAGVRPRAPAEAFVRIETLPGEQAQADWAHVGRLAVPGGERALWLFLVVLGHSRAMWGELVFDLSVESLCRSLTRAVAFFQGVPRQCLFDNPKTVVLERQGDAARFHATLLGLCARLHMQPRLCGVRKPEQKGKVERAIRFLRERFFAGRHILDIATGNAELLRFIREIAHERPHPRLTDRKVAEVFEEERRALLPLPDPLPSTETARPAFVDKSASVRFDTNLYSVPPEHVGQTLALAVDDRELRVLEGGREVARHARSFGRHQVIEDSRHRAAILAAKPGAHEVKGRDRLRAICPRIDELLARCIRDERLTGAFISRLARLLDLYGDRVFKGAIEDVLDRGGSDIKTIVVACERRRKAESQPVPVEVELPAHIPDREVIPHSLENYDEA